MNSWGRNAPRERRNTDVKQLIEYDAIIIECETWEKLKRYYTRERIIRRIDYNLNTLCKKWNIKAELLTDKDRYKGGECWDVVIDWERQTDKGLEFTAFEADSKILALTEKRKNLIIGQSTLYEMILDKNNVSKPW